jgi:uncharacterized repeat protein (TIGR01451 family)
MTCTGQGIAQTGGYVNIGTATGQHNGTTVEDEDPSHYVAEPLPGGAELATLGDFIWLDANGNGIQDEGEDGVEGVEVQLYQVIEGEGMVTAQTQTTGVGGGVTTGQTQTTDANGFYSFADLEPGTYYVVFVLPEGFSFTLPNVGDNPAINSKATVPELTLAVNREIDIVRPGGVMTYTLDYTNEGNRAAEGVSLTFDVPEYLSIDLTRNPGWACPGGTVAGNTCTYQVGTLQPGTGSQLTLYLDVDQTVQAVPMVVILSVNLWQSTNGLGFVTTLEEGDSDMRHDAGLVTRQPNISDDEPITIVLPPTSLPVGDQPGTTILPGALFLPTLSTSN